MKDLASTETCCGYLTSTRHIRDCTTIVRLSSIVTHLYRLDPSIQMAHDHIRARTSILPTPSISSDHIVHSPRHLPLARMVDPESSRERRMTASLLLCVVAPRASGRSSQNHQSWFPPPFLAVDFQALYRDEWHYVREDTPIQQQLGSHTTFQLYPVYRRVDSPD